MFSKFLVLACVCAFAVAQKTPREAVSVTADTVDGKFRVDFAVDADTITNLDKFLDRDTVGGAVDDALDAIIDAQRVLDLGLTSAADFARFDGARIEVCREVWDKITLNSLSKRLRLFPRATVAELKDRVSAAVDLSGITIYLVFKICTPSSGTVPRRRRGRRLLAVTDTALYSDPTADNKIVVQTSVDGNGGVSLVGDVVIDAREATATQLCTDGRYLMDAAYVGDGQSFLDIIVSLTQATFDGIRALDGCAYPDILYVTRLGGTNVRTNFSSIMDGDLAARGRVRVYTEASGTTYTEHTFAVEDRGVTAEGNDQLDRVGGGEYAVCIVVPNADRPRHECRAACTLNPGSAVTGLCCHRSGEEVTIERTAYTNTCEASCECTHVLDGSGIDTCSDPDPETTEEATDDRTTDEPRNEATDEAETTDAPDATDEPDVTDEPDATDEAAAETTDEAEDTTDETTDAAEDNTDNGTTDEADDTTPGTTDAATDTCDSECAAFSVVVLFGLNTDNHDAGEWATDAVTDDSCAYCVDSGDDKRCAGKLLNTDLSATLEGARTCIQCQCETLGQCVWALRANNANGCPSGLGATKAAATVATPLSFMMGFVTVIAAFLVW